MAGAQHIPQHNTFNLEFDLKFQTANFSNKLWITKPQSLEKMFSGCILSRGILEI